MLQAGLIALAVLAVWPASADAVDLRFPDGRVAQPYQRWADAAKVPTPNVAAAVYRGHCPGWYSGCMLHDENWREPWRIYLPQRERTRLGLGHYLGTLYDETQMTDTARRAFLQLMHDSRDWVSPPNSPDEQFAEAYAFCARQNSYPFKHLPGGGWDYSPTVRQHTGACALIRHTAGWYMRPTSAPDSAE